MLWSIKKAIQKKKKSNTNTSDENSSNRAIKVNTLDSLINQRKRIFTL